MSVHAVCDELGVGLQELPDWSCCGASSAHCTNFRLSLALPARNLAIAEREGMDLAVSCPACFLRFKKAAHELEANRHLSQEILHAVGMPYEGKYRTRHLLDIFYHDVGVTTVRGRVRTPLTGLKAVSYYGCLLVRPSKVTGFDHPENPVLMDSLMEALGATTIDWAGKVDCCGGSLALTRTDIVERLVEDLMASARRAGAACVITACPLCQTNLDVRQKPGGGAALPVLYFTELLGLAMGLPDAKKWFRKHMVSPFGLLRKHRLL